MSTSFERRVDARFVLSVVACGIMSFSGVVVETAMNITFPTLTAEFVVDTATVQWIATGYLLVLAAIMPLSALLKRCFRTKRCSWPPSCCSRPAGQVCRPSAC